MNENSVQPLLVTTEYRGVFFGYGIPTTEKTIRLTDVQMCVYWSSDLKGVLGLATSGPTKQCKIGPPAPAMTLQAITSIIEVSAEAAKRWKEQPWN
jgi:hypothetical protein